jgi:hypothetical protein
MIKIHKFARLTFLSAMMLIFSLPGCEDITQPATDSEIFQMKAETSIVGQNTITLSGECETAFDPPSGAFPVIYQVDIGTCLLSHLGKSTFVSIKEINLLSGIQKSDPAIFTAANGDTLRATGEGTSSFIGPGIVSFNAILIFNGGTGRFENASGSVEVEGEADTINRTARFELTNGQINYDASDRRK